MRLVFPYGTNAAGYPSAPNGELQGNVITETTGRLRIAVDGKEILNRQVPRGTTPVTVPVSGVTRIQATFTIELIAELTLNYNTSPIEDSAVYPERM